MNEINKTETPEEVRNLIDEDERQEWQSESGKWYTVEGGELKQVAA